MVRPLFLIAALSLGTTARAAAGLPDSRLGTPTAPILLLTRADVRAELKLSPEQAAEADRVIGDLRDRGRALRGQVDDAARSARREIDRASRTWVETRLAPEQGKRLVQLDLQWSGPAAMLDPIVADSLQLTEPQRLGLARALVERDRARENGPPIPADEAKLRNVALGLLDEAQRTRWAALNGPAFAFRIATRNPVPESATR